MTKKDKQAKVNKLFKEHVNENKIIMTENGQCFFSPNDAQSYHDQMGFEQDPEVFFREGVEIKDDSDLEKALDQAEKSLSEKTSVLKQAEEALSADVEVDQSTPEIVAEIIQLKEKLTLSQKDNERLQGELTNMTEAFEALKESVEPEKPKSDAKAKTDSKKA